MKHLRLILVFLTIQLSITAQELWQKKIDVEQKVLCKKDSNNNCTITISSNAEVNLIVTSFILDKVDDIQKNLTNNKTLTNNDRVKYLRMLLSIVNMYNTAARSRNKDFNANLAKELFTNYDKIIEAINNKNNLSTIIQPLGYLASKLILETEFIQSANGYADAKELLLLKDCTVHPDKILNIINANPNFKYADSLIALAAYRNQDKIYDFAQCIKCPIYNKLKNHTNTLVQTLFKMAQMESGRALTPFLDAISRKEITMDSINKIQNNPHQYYKLLVNTRIQYAKRLNNEEKVLAINNFNEKIKEAALDFVKEINEAHTKPDNIRFAPIVPLNSQELYYMAVYGIDELFTSSFNKGVFAQLITKLNGVSTDKLLGQVQNDYFRKFIKISANYNKLAIFLKLMPDSSGKVLMNNFISDLVTNDNVQDVEDAVDVADAYVGIGVTPELKSISTQILNKVKEYKTQYKNEENIKGETVYRLFDLIFKSYGDTAVDLSSQLGLPPINKVPYAVLAPKDKTVVKLYFYGDEDKDGQMSFANFMGIFGDKTKWKVDGNTNYVSIKSLKGKAIEIYANRPLYDISKKTDPDDSAKIAMCAFMEKQGIQPTFVMHRGHSYHVPITLKYMEQYDTAAKLIVLGSCGGYQNLQKVLEICPDAHIVSSKQTGTMYVNDPMLREMFADIGQGKNIVWPEIWPRIKANIMSDKLEMFEEYIPPNKNLGMIFIKAYKKEMKL
jgi:hypothetical protein